LDKIFIISTKQVRKQKKNAPQKAKICEKPKTGSARALRKAEKLLFSFKQ
jgi:hypothetical protein